MLATTVKVGALIRQWATEKAMICYPAWVGWTSIQHETLTHDQLLTRDLLKSLGPDVWIAPEKLPNGARSNPFFLPEGKCAVTYACLLFRP